MPTFIGLRKYLVIGQLNEYQFFSAFHWSTSDTPPANHMLVMICFAVFHMQVSGQYSINTDASGYFADFIDKRQIFL